MRKHQVYLVQICPPMLEHVHATANKIDNFFGNIGVYDLFAINRSRCKNDTVRIYYYRGAAQRYAIIDANPIRQNKVALIFNCAGEREDAEMLDSNDRPG